MDTFDPESLSAISQLGLGLAGFSGIGLLLTRRSGQLQRFEIFRLGIMLGTAVGAMFLSLVPVALAQFGLAAATVCRLSAGAMAVFSIAFVIYFIVATRHFLTTVPEIVSWSAISAAITGHSLNFVSQTASALGLLEHCVGVYWLGLLWLLLHATYQFWRILFVRPLDQVDV